MSKTQYLTVASLTKYLKQKFERDPYLERVYLIGEVSNYRNRQNSHQYFSLKDEKAKINAVMFKSAFQKLKFSPEEGMKVLVIGRISLYEATGQYQIYVEHMEPDGVGALYQALRERQEKLAVEGLFSGEKRALNKYPEKIAVVTSPSGAVIRDIMTTIKRRYPLVELTIFPTLVQGNQAAPDIVSSLKQADEGNFDTIILARGGGSIEDLWPFNEEIVVRTIYSLQTPLISSVGHETDTTLADLVADVRAATPTAAAELAVPNLQEEWLKLKEREQRLLTSMTTRMEKERTRLATVMESYVMKQPHRLYENYSLALDRQVIAFKQAMKNTLYDKEAQFQDVTHRLKQQQPKARIDLASQQADYLERQLLAAKDHYQQKKEQQFIELAAALDMLSPLKTMTRGYSYVTKDEKIVKSVKQVAPQDEMMIHVADGTIQSTVTTIQHTIEGEV